MLFHCVLLLPLFVWGSVFRPCFVMQYFIPISSFASILMGKREMDALLIVSSRCRVTVGVLSDRLSLFLAMLWVGL